jgi:hypothetical protein
MLKRDLMISPVNFPDLRLSSSNERRQRSPNNPPASVFEPLSATLHEGSQEFKNKFYARSRFLLRYHFPPKVAIYFRRWYAKGCKVGVQGQMAVSNQYREPERAAAQSPQPTVESLPPRGACLSVRLWSARADSGDAPSLWENDSPAACLTLDLIAASEGIPTARRGEVLVASFPTFFSAAMSARRLQWAAQGYSESEEPRSTSLALLIHAPEEGEAETVAEDAFHSLEQAAPGSILLTEKASQPFDRLPGFPLQVAAGDGLWELAWSSPEGHFSRSEDEQFLAQLAAKQGVPERVPEPPPPQPVVEMDFAEEYRTGSHHTGSYRTGSYRTGSYRQPPQDESRRRSGTMIGGLVFATVVVLAAAFLYYTHGRSNPAPAADQTAAQGQSQTESASTQDADTLAGKEAPATTVQPRHPGASERTDATPAGKQSKNTPNPEAPKQADTPAPEKERPAPKQVEPPTPRNNNSGGRCDLDPSQYSGQIDQAWKNLGRGKYSAALRQFAAVLACDSGNARAREGLERARMASADADGTQ